jgi:hypothetical protein
MPGRQGPGERGAWLRALDEDRVEHPWPISLCDAPDCDLGRGPALRVEGAEIDQERIGARRELANLVGRDRHRRHGAKCQQHVGGDILRNRVGDAVHARRTGAHALQDGGRAGDELVSKGRGGCGLAGGGGVPHLKLPPPA